MDPAPAELEALAEQANVMGCAPECADGHDGLAVWYLHHGCSVVGEQASDEETGQSEGPVPVDLEVQVAAPEASSAEIVAKLPACVVIKGVDIVKCQRRGRPTVRSRLHGEGKCSPCCADMPVCKSCGRVGIVWLGVAGYGLADCDQGHCDECCAQRKCCEPKDDQGAPAAPPRRCGCKPQSTEDYECEGCGWQQRCL